MKQEQYDVAIALAFDGIVGAYAGPFTPGTAYLLLHYAFGEESPRAVNAGNLEFE